MQVHFRKLKGIVQFSFFQTFVFSFGRNRNMQATLDTDQGPHSALLAEITDFRAIEVFDPETNGPKLCYIVVIGGAITILQNTPNNEAAYHKWRAFKKTYKP